MKNKNKHRRFLAFVLAFMLIFTGTFNITSGVAMATTNLSIDDYIKTNYINQKIITTGGEGITQKGDVCEIGLKAPSGANISSFRLKVEKPDSQYKSGWFVDNMDWQNGSKAWNPVNPGSRSIKRNTSDGGPITFKATLKLYDRATTDDEAIKNDTAVALGSHEFTVKILPEAKKYEVEFVAVDKITKEKITNATVKVEKEYSTISPVNGKYTFEEGTIVNVTVQADGYVRYSNEFIPTKSGVENIELTPASSSKITFDIKDNQNNLITDAKVSVRRGYYDTVKPNKDGSYTLENGVSYNYRIEKVNCKTVEGSIIPSGDKTIEVKLLKDILKYTVAFNITDKSTGIKLDDVKIQVTYEEYDDFEMDFVTYPVSPQKDGTYILDKDVEYTYTITKPGYKKIIQTYTPVGESENITIDVPMSLDKVIDPKDQAACDAAKKAFDSEYGALRPTCKTDTNINTFIAKKDYCNGITVEVKKSGDTDYIGLDGSIHYYAGEIGYLNSKNVSCTFAFKKGNAEAVSKDKTVTVGWSIPHVHSKMQSEANMLTSDSIKGNNIDLNNIKSNLTLPQCMASGLNKAWSVIDWKSSNPQIANIKYGSIDSKLYPATLEINPQKDDTKVTLTATFKANDAILNNYVESVEDFGTITKTFEITVKGNGQAKPTEDELKDILDKYYTVDKLKDSISEKIIDPNNVTGDIQLLRYTKIKDEYGKLVFNNKEIKVKSSNEKVITINGYRANVDIFTKENPNVDLIIEFTREGVTVEKKISLKVGTVTDEQLDAEIAKMEIAKKHYFDGINDGQYKNENAITGNLHSFKEMRIDKDGNPIWIYKSLETVGDGIITDDFFENPWEMEGAGYNWFKSSNNAVVQHDNLNVTRPQTTTSVTISSVLSSAKYGKFAKKHPENTKLQKLYKQPVEVTVKVRGTLDEKEALNKEIANSKEFLDKIVEGKDPAQYAEGTKARLKEAIEKAKKVANNKNATIDEIDTALENLSKAIREAKHAQNPKVANIIIKASTKSNEIAALKKLDITSDLAAKYGYSKLDEFFNEVTVLDGLVAIHKEMYGADFEKNPTKYLVVNKGMISTIFGKQTFNVGYLINHKYPVDETGMGTLADNTILKNKDLLEVFIYGDTVNWEDRLLFFKDENITAKEGEDIKLQLMGTSAMIGGEPISEADCTVVLKNIKTGKEYFAVTDKSGMAIFSNLPAGDYFAMVSKCSYEYFIAPYANISIEENAKEEPSKPIIPEIDSEINNGGNLNQDNSSNKPDKDKTDKPDKPKKAPIEDKGNIVKTNDSFPLSDMVTMIFLTAMGMIALCDRKKVR